ncbi:hypothetical protein VZF83_08910 [Synechococcus elongatus IITB3]|uniref:PilW family protein n=1 Tax=Synechococcus elongatus TaxID=32046 RepID=UPI0030D3931D
MRQKQHHLITATAGFTVAELLVGSVLGVIVILAGGFVLSTNLSTDRRVAELSKQRNQLNLALEFISSEIRRSRRIVLNTDLTASTQCRNSNRQPILSLEVPKESGGFHTITYAVQPIASNHIWQGPHAIYRCGPSFTSDGRYTENSSQQADVLLDGIASQADLNAAVEACAELATTRRSSHTAAVHAELLESQRLASLLIGLVVHPNRGEQQVICDSRLVTPRS